MFCFPSTCLTVEDTEEKELHLLDKYLSFDKMSRFFVIKILFMTNLM